VCVCVWVSVCVSVSVSVRVCVYVYVTGDDEVRVSRIAHASGPNVYRKAKGKRVLFCTGGGGGGVCVSPWASKA